MIPNFKSLKEFDAYSPILKMVQNNLDIIFEHSFNHKINVLDEASESMEEDIQEEFLLVGYLYELMGVVVKNAYYLGIEITDDALQLYIMLMNISCYAYLNSKHSHYGVALAQLNYETILQIIEEEESSHHEFNIDLPFRYELLGDCVSLIDTNRAKQYYHEAKQKYGYMMNKEFEHPLPSAYLVLQSKICNQMFRYRYQHFQESINHISRIIHKEYISSIIVKRHIQK